VATLLGQFPRSITAVAGGSELLLGVLGHPAYPAGVVGRRQGHVGSLDQAGAVHSFGALPLIVLSRDPLVDPDPDWQRNQTELLKLSSSSQQLFADKSGHSIEFDQPDAAVGAIEKTVEQARAQTLVAAR